MMIRLFALLAAATLTLASAPGALADSGGTLLGRVTLQDKGTPLHQVSVRLVQLRRSVDTDESGAYRFDNIPPGRYTVLAHLDRFPDVVDTVEIRAGESYELDFVMSVTTVAEEVTVTATGEEVTAFESFQSVSTLNALELSQKANPSIGEVLEDEPGVAKRSFGPGTARPVIRGFDGDRVMVVEDGVRSGSLGSQSGDHGETVNVLTVDKVEVVKGPATLLYGSSAIGGVVNAVSEHNQMHDDAHEGLRGFLTGVGGTTNALGGFAAGAEYGVGKALVWGNGGSQRSGDYGTPAGEIPNSASRVGNLSLGAGYFGDRAFASGTYTFEDSRYGVPFANLFEGIPDPIDLAVRNHAVRFNAGLRGLGTFVDGVRASLSYSDYQHKELEGEAPATVFDNSQIVFRADADQRRVGALSGQFGVWGMRRDYSTTGEETLSPPVLQDAFAAFGLEELDFGRVRFQLGGRVERNGYDVDDPALRDRAFTGFSGAAGVRVGLWDGGAVVANYTRSHRAPALEELYNFGPHVGNLTFEVGSDALRPETADGVELSLRHQEDRFRAELNVFYYRFEDFIYLAPTGEIEDGLRVANYRQAPVRYLGGELELTWQIHPMLAWSAGVDAVDAELTETGTPLPRIPPFGGHAGLVLTRGGLTVNPRFVFADRQDQVFPTETPTAGYGRLDLDASYTVAREHVAHVVSVSAFNLTDALYRNHLSYIKDLAPEIGRGVRASYTVRFF